MMKVKVNHKIFKNTVYMNSLDFMARIYLLLMYWYWYVDVKVVMVVNRSIR